MRRYRFRLGRLVPGSVLAAAVALVGNAPALAQDDLNLLRKDSQNPYLFFVLDTSTSMGTEIRTHTFLDAYGDDPRSKLYAAKEAIYEVFKDSTGFRFGLATYDQGELRVSSKHWLYYVPATYTDPLTGAVTDQAATLGSLTIGWPKVVSSGVPVEPGILPDGDLLVFGKAFPTGTTSLTGDDGSACDKAIDIGTADGRLQANRIPRLGEDGGSPTDIWIKTSSGTRYLVSYTLSAGTFGNRNFTLRLDVASSPCADPAAPVLTALPASPQTVVMQLEREFLMWDTPIGNSGEAELFKDNVKGGTARVTEITAGYWDFSDIQGSFDCNDTKPFSGSGWEGNYDTSSSQVPGDAADEWCTTPGDPTSCRNLKQETVLNTSLDPTPPPLVHVNTLDVGDVLPFSWLVDTQSEFLARLNPNHGSSDPPNFGASGYFNDTDVADGVVDDLLQLRTPNRKPILAGGNSPMGTAMLDFRCWYVGHGANKCERIEFYPDGFTRLQRKNDPAYQCRRPYLILVSDGEENCGDRNNWNSAVSNFSGTSGQDQDKEPLFGQIWVLNVGTPQTDPKDPFNTIGPKDGKVIDVATKQQLYDELRKIRGIIEEETRAFASAAVPSVQADVADKIYLTSFEPVDGLPYWRGHADAYLKPLPTKIDVATGVSLPDPTDPRHLWDAGEKLKGQVAGVLDYTQAMPPTIPIPTTASALSLGATKTTRRVYYPTAKSSDAVPRDRRLLAPPSGPASENPLREDLYQGLGVLDPLCPLGTTDPSTFDTISCIKAQRDAAETVLVKTLYKKMAEVDGVNQTYILGDTFHANPQVIGGPSNQAYLSHPDDFPGYRAFFDKFARRRKVLILSANDGQLHAFDAGRFIGAVDTGEFDDAFDSDGGTELFSWVPRALLPKLTAMSDGSAEHVWSMDGNPVAFDAFLDPAHSGTPDPTKREWRTVLFSGLRQGGTSVIALDITQPDSLVEDTPPSSTVFGVRPSHTNVLPDCANSLGSGSVSSNGNELGCDDRLPYPSLLWEFTDDEWTQAPDGTILSFGPDGNSDDVDGCPGVVDIGETWSTPNLGVILLAKSDVSGNKLLDGDGNPLPDQRYVAIFGGGRDPSGETEDPNVASTCRRGRNIYVVDVETGKILHKEAVIGSVAAEPAAVDTNQDGYLDRIYFATTSGFLYRMDIGAQAATLDGRVVPEGVDWQAWKIFDTMTKETDEDGDMVLQRRPVFFRPSVFFLPDSNEYAVAIATGSRDNMWIAGPVGGNRIFVFTDDIVLGGSETLPRLEGNLTDVVDFEATYGLGGVDFLNVGNLKDSSKKRGWFLRLMGTPPVLGDPRPNEVAVTPVTAISGLTSLSTFVPNVSTQDAALGKLCLQRGTSFNYLAFTDNAEGVYPDSADLGTEADRSVEVGGVFVSEPFVEQGQTKNEVATTDDPCAGKEAIAEALKTRIFPSNCRFSYFRFDLKNMRSDTGIECITSIPVCIVEKNWKEF